MFKRRNESSGHSFVDTMIVELWDGFIQSIKNKKS